MAGRISEADRERVRDANPIDRVIAEFVTLKSAGGGNLKGLCPFHDEKTASFTVSPGRAGGRYYCFGCNSGGDVFGFLMAMEHLSYLEAVQRLADRAGITLTVIDGGGARPERGSRARLIAANRAAAEFYAAQLAGPEAEVAREYLSNRGFDAEAARTFGCGFAPAGWDSLVKALTAQGFSLDELYTAGLAKQGRQGPIDAFHRRLLWSIRDPAGDVVGFGARRLFDDDKIEAKYLNTGETPLYRKSQILFGLDLAKREIGRQHRAVVVEGYTDVMAMHLAGIPVAVASCGTAFGDEHIGVLRRYLLDADVVRGEVIYTFDGDAAGQKAALKAFDSDQKFAVNTFVSVAEDGMDPCELRQARGDAAVRELVTRRIPLFDFAIRKTVAQYDVSTAEGRMSAANAAIPLVAKIKESMLRDDYARQLAGRLGADPQPIVARVRAAVGGAPSRAARSTASPSQAQQTGRPDPADRRLLAARETLKLVLQQPDLLVTDYTWVEAEFFTDPAYRAVHEAVLAAGGPSGAVANPGGFVDQVADQLPAGPLRSLVAELAVERTRTRARADAGYAGATLASLALPTAVARERQLGSELQRAEAEGDLVGLRNLSKDLMEASAYRRALQEHAGGMR